MEKKKMSIANMSHLWLLATALLIGLLGQLTEAALFQSPSSSSSMSTSSSFFRLRANKLRRPDLCRENFPRKQEDLPALVITGKVKEVYLASNGENGPAPAMQQSQISGPFTGLAGNTNKALVNVGRVIRGNQQLLSTDIIVSGFNSSNSTPCPNYIKQNDTLILLLNHEADRRYSIQGNNILSMNLANLDRVNALANDESLKRRPPIDDILCEAHYCPYGRCAVTNEKLGQVSCQCPDVCLASYSPVCGSDNVTYTNECQLIKEGCRLKRPLFVTRESAC